MDFVLDELKKMERGLRFDVDNLPNGSEQHVFKLHEGGRYPLF